MLVLRVTGDDTNQDIISCRIIDPKKIPSEEPFLYHNLDTKGNTSITTEWDISHKLSSSATIKAATLQFDGKLANCREFRFADNYLAVVQK